MIIRKSFRFRLEPNSQQRQQLARFAGSARWVWNQTLAEQKRRREAGEHTAGYAEMCRWLTGWRHALKTAWLAEVHVHPLQQRLKDLDRALRDTFRKGGDPARKAFPRFRKKGFGDSFRYPMSVKAEIRSDGWGQVWLPKIGWIRYRSSRPLEGTIAQATVVQEGPHWFVSIQTEQEVADPPPNEQNPVGVDLGVVRFATLSDETKPFDPLNAFKRIRKRLVRLQRQLARKKKFSANWRRQKRRIACLRRREAAARLDFLHQTSTTIAKNHGVVVLEDLQVRNMSRSAQGTVEEPGKNVRAKAGLNCSLLDQGWYAFRQMLAYKLAERGGKLILVPPQHTSQRCSGCGYVEADNRPSQAVFRCLRCGFELNADRNAARNILQAAGYAVSACGGIGRRPPCEAGTPREVA